jgi:ribosome biogenesis SPOUT family RNA methylase Rps3
MPPKEKLKVKKNPLKKNRVILLHMVTVRDLSMRVKRKKGIIVIKNIMGFY